MLLFSGHGELETGLLLQFLRFPYRLSHRIFLTILVVDQFETTQTSQMVEMSEFKGFTQSWHDLHYFNTTTRKKKALCKLSLTACTDKNGLRCSKIFHSAKSRCTTLNIHRSSNTVSTERSESSVLVQVDHSPFFPWSRHISLH